MLLATFVALAPWNAAKAPVKAADKTAVKAAHPLAAARLPIDETGRIASSDDFEFIESIDVPTKDEVVMFNSLHGASDTESDSRSTFAFAPVSFAVDGPHRSPGRPPPPRTTDEVFRNFDRNHDDILSPDEIPRHLERSTGRADLNDDGSVAKIELELFHELAPRPPAWEH